jgi:hypothetical protein
MDCAKTADKVVTKGGRVVGILNRYRTFAAAIACGAAVMMVGAGVGDAASPAAVTGAAASVTSTSADVTGTINPSGLETFWEFQWGTSTAYGNNTIASGPIAGSTSNSVLAPISGLQPDTTYHFRLVAIQGAAGVSGSPTVSGGNDESFTTPKTGAGSTTSNAKKHAKASLRSHTLTVRHGSTLIPWGCSGTSGAICKGKISLTARGRIAGRLQNVTCGGGTFTASTGRHHTVRANLGKNCLSLVKSAHRHRLGATLKASFSQGTGNLKTKVTLVLG